MEGPLSPERGMASQWQQTDLLGALGLGAAPEPQLRQLDGEADSASLQQNPAADSDLVDRTEESSRPSTCRPSADGAGASASSAPSAASGPTSGANAQDTVSAAVSVETRATELVGLAEPWGAGLDGRQVPARSGQNHPVVSMLTDLPCHGPALDAGTQPDPASVDKESCLDPLPTAPEHLLILDTETTALSPSEGSCIEVGAVLFHVPCRAVLTQVSFLLPCACNPAEQVNGIPSDVSRLPQPWQPALACFIAMAEQSDAVLAHNASFDRQWFGVGSLPPLAKPWICSMEDIRWPASLGLRSTPSLQSLALAFGVPVWAAHRALTDCTYLVQVFQRCQDLEHLLAKALEPRTLMRADVSYADRHLAREAGFRWDQSVPKAWTRRLSCREARALPFPVHPVDPDTAASQDC